MNARAWTKVTVISSAAATTTGNGAATDMATYATTAKREVKAIITVLGLTTTTTGTVAITECATTNGTFSTPLAGTSTKVFTTDGNYEINFRNDLRYVRGELTLNAAGSVNIAVNIIALQREANS